MLLHARGCILTLLLGLTATANSIKCERTLDGTSTPASPLEGRFWITLATNNRTEIIDQYMPNVRYTVTIEGKKAPELGPAGQLKFTRFLLTAENKNDSLAAGTFDLGDDLLTQFSDKCPSAVTERTKVAKADVAVYWTSPPEGSGCVLIRATVMETVESWFTNEGGLVRTVCQNPKAVVDDPGEVLDECCACDEAKYEVTFEGLWSRNTHPKDFPSKGWLIRFSDVIGASHTLKYRFWNYGEAASDGLRQVAEFGSTRKLESELKDESENIRTIIKARGITYPNVTGRTFAVFRVDRKHHLMSLVSMIMPSPDWIVGTSGLELCLPDCSWIEHKQLNLYPVDVGTDDGITYTSPDSPTNPPGLIRGITTSWPDDPRSPFYDSSGIDMKPMARLHLNRQRLYEKTCDDTVATTGSTGGPDEDIKRPRNKACKTTPWGDWGECSPTCSQLRQRNFRNVTAAMLNNCTDLLTDRRPCPASDPCVAGNNTRTLLDSPECELSEWTTWSGCTATCGEANEVRRRNFIYKKYRKYCRAVEKAPPLQQTLRCSIPACPDPEFDKKCPERNYTPWSDWSPCKSLCGGGTYTRTRQPLGYYAGEPECTTQTNNCTAQIAGCDLTKQEAMEICSEPPLGGECDGHWNRWYYDQETEQCKIFVYHGCKGNRNNFGTVEDCLRTCVNFQEMKSPEKNFKVSISSVLSYHIPQDQRSVKTKRAKSGNLLNEASEDDLPFRGIQSGNQVAPSNRVHDDGKRIDCRYTDWTEWTSCNDCRGYSYKTREILVPAKNGGSRCPTKLMRKQRCRRILKCSPASARRRRRYRDRKSVQHHNEISVDCELSHWSPWSACNASCGESFQHRTRKSKFQRHDSRGKPCTKLVEFRKCSTFPCL